jgi:hypothetical protein
MPVIQTKVELTVSAQRWCDKWGSFALAYPLSLRCTDGVVRAEGKLLHPEIGLGADRGSLDHGLGLRGSANLIIAA